MTGLFDMLLSPTGIALYIGFWIVKILAGAWLLRQASMLLPERTQIWIKDKFNFGRSEDSLAPGWWTMK